jgi:hypothetical protein
VLLNYYGNKLVEWRSDNTFTLHAPKYYSAYSGDQIIGFVPRSMFFEWNRGRLFVQTDGASIEVIRRQSLKFVPVEKTYNGYPVFKVENAPDVQVYRVKRGVADAITKRRFVAFLEWVALTSSIVPSVARSEMEESYAQFRAALGYTDEFLAEQKKAVDGLPWDGEREHVMAALCDVDYLPYSVHRLGGAFHRASAELLAEWMSGNNPDKWLSALNVVQDYAGVFKFHMDRNAHIDIPRVYEYIKGVAAFLHRDEAFKVITLPAGTVPSKRNSEYFREIHIDFGQTD